MLQTRTCACARRALHEPPYRTSVRAARIHPSPALATVGWAVGAVRFAAAATLEAVAARMRRTVRAGPEDGPAIFATTRGIGPTTATHSEGGRLGDLAHISCICFSGARRSGEGPLTVYGPNPMGAARTQLCAYAYATVLERGAAASIDIDAAVAAHHDEFAFPM